MNIEKLKSLLGNDEKLVWKFLHVFKNETPHQLEKLQRAIEQRDWENISIIAHGIKSQAKYLDLRKIAALAADIEQCGEEKDDLEGLPIYFYELDEKLQEVITGMD